MNYIKKKIKEYEHKFKTVKDLKITKSNREGKRFKATFMLKGVQNCTLWISRCIYIC